MNLAWPALGWGFVLFAALVGWGRLLSRAVFRTAAPWRLAGAWGIVATVLLGGLANSFALFSRASVIGYVLLGAIACAVEVARNRTDLRTRLAVTWRTVRGDWLLLVLLALLVAILTVRYASAPVRHSYQYHPDFAGMPFNMHDDMQSYLVMPEKMLQLGHLAPDPYNTRQLEATLGGMHVLTALGRAALPFEKLHLVEDGVGLLVACSVLSVLLGRLRATPRMQAFLLLAAQCSFEHNLNISSYLSAAAVIGALLWLLLEAEPSHFLSFRWSLGLGLLLATAAALKSTLIPPVGLLAGIALVARLIVAPDRRALRAAGIATAVLLLALLPWMTLKQRTYGTPLFPLLGKGNHWTQYTAPPDDATASTWTIFLRETGRDICGPTAAGALAIVLAGVPAIRRRLRTTEWSVIFGGNAAWCIGTYAMGWPGGGFSVTRYLWPLAINLVPLTFLVASELAHTIGPAVWRRGVILSWCAVLGGWLWLHHAYTYVYLGLALIEDLAVTQPHFPIASEDVRAGAQSLQASVPAGAPMLVRVTHPFLLDFQRNPIFVADWPGGASPPPGLPVFRGAEPLAEYLRAQGIRYVAYSYRLEALFQRALYSWRMDPDQPKWERQVARMAFDFHSNLEFLGITRRRIFDDEETFVIDLAGELGR